MRGDYQIGAFRGRELIQRHGEVGGAKSVFVKLQGIKNELVYPTFGGEIKNPFKGAAKFYAGDLVEYRTNENGVKPEIYILKTYKLHKQASGVSEIEIERTPYSHKVFVGDNIAVAPAKIGGTVTNLKVTAVVEGKSEELDHAPVWKVTVSGSVTADKGSVLVETDGSKNMLVKSINGVVDCDLDMFDIPSTGDDDFDGARYMYTPALGGVMYINKMSAMPKCVLDLNKSNINGWFKVQF